MDQAASILCTPNSALYITFFPSLNAELVSLPHPSTPGSGVVLVCANSLVVSDKVVGAKTRYNLRVVEALVAARVLAKQLNLTIPESPNGKGKGKKKNQHLRNRKKTKCKGVEEGVRE